MILEECLHKAETEFLASYWASTCKTVFLHFSFRWCYSVQALNALINLGGW